MRKLIVTASAAAMLVASSFAALAEEATGAIAAIDPATGTVILATGETFLLPQGFDAASLQVGQEVTITYEEGAGGEMEVMDVAPAS